MTEKCEERETGSESQKHCTKFNKRVFICLNLLLGLLEADQEDEGNKGLNLKGACSAAEIVQIIFKVKS